MVNKEFASDAVNVGLEKGAEDPVDPGGLLLAPGTGNECLTCRFTQNTRR